MCTIYVSNAIFSRFYLNFIFMFILFSVWQIFIFRYIFINGMQFYIFVHFFIFPICVGMYVYASMVIKKLWIWIRKVASTKIHINSYHFYYKSILSNESNVLLWIVSSENRLYRIMWMCWATRGSHRSSQYLKSTANYSSQYSNGSLNLRNSSRRRKGLHECDTSYHSTRFRN